MGRMSHIRRNMVEENKDYRDEQILCAKILRELLGEEYEVKLEETVILKPFANLPVKGAIPDIVVLGKGMKIAIRMMGAIHEKPRKRIKDEDQRLVLMANGWRVMDFWYYDMVELWNPKKYTDKEIKDSIVRNFKV
jgi:very-short-patch-repair endonuclease